MFRGMTEKEVQEFLERANARTVRLAPGEHLFSQGEIPRELFILKEGCAVVENIDANGNRVVVNVFDTPGTVLGEVYLYLDGVYDFTCRVIRRVEALCIPKAALMFDGNEDPLRDRLLNNMLNILAHKAHFLNRKLLIVNASSLRRKIARFLLANSKGENGLELIFNREDLADFLGVTRPSLSRELMNMQNEGRIVVQRERIRFDRKKLEELL